MKLHYQSACRLVALSFFCLLIAVREADGTFVPGRCMCPQTQPGVRGQLKDLTVFPQSPSCNKITLIVTLRTSNAQVCLSPDAAMGKQLIRCWNRARRANRDTKACLRRKRRGGQRRRPAQRRQDHNRRTSS